MSHTPGPWKIETGKPFDYPSPSGSRPDHCIVGVGDGSLSEPFHHVADAGYAGSSEVVANARLIAAAPDLLAALICLRKTMYSDKSEESIMADAAIAKAKGLTP